MTQAPYTHMVVRYDARDLRHTEVVYVATSLAEASRVNRRLIHTAARGAGSPALYAIREYDLLPLYQKGDW